MTQLVIAFLCGAGAVGLVWFLVARCATTSGERKSGGGPCEADPGP